MNKASLKTNINKFVNKLRNINDNFVSNTKKEIVTVKERFSKSILNFKHKNNKIIEIRKLPNIIKLEDQDVFNNIFDVNESNEVKEVQNINDM